MELALTLSVTKITIRICKKTYFREFNLLAVKFDNKHILKTLGIYGLTIEDIRLSLDPQNSIWRIQYGDHNYKKMTISHCISTYPCKNNIFFLIF